MTERRKLVSIVFADVVNSTALGEEHDPELVRGVMGRYFARMKEIAEAHGGTVEKFIGDAVMVVFGVPRLHEDDAERAVRAALAMRDAVAELNPAPLPTFALRIGVNSGHVVTGADEDRQLLVTGDAVNVAARLQQGAEPNEVVVGALTERLTRGVIDYEPRDPIATKGKPEPVAAFRAQRLPSALPGSRRAAPGLLAPFVGRERELRQLMDAIRHAEDERTGYLVTVVGNAGVGKSRLVAELLSRLAVAADLRTLKGRCLPYGAGIAYWPLMEILRQDAGIKPEDGRAAALAKLSQRLAGLVPADQLHAIQVRLAVLLGLEAPGGVLSDVPVERIGVELSWGLRQYVEAVAALGPLVVVIDDLQWADPAALDVLSEMADRASRAPYLLLCVGRAELLERNPTWSARRPNATLLALEPLDEPETHTLLSGLLGTEDAPSPVGSLIAERSAGNPLFCEELVRMLIEARYLELADGRWHATRSAADLPLPETIQAIVAARIDGLPSAQRACLERASVIGERFSLDDLVALDQAIGAAPEGLLRSGFLVADREDPSGRSLRFKHILIRDAAYAGLTIAERAELHQRFAEIRLRTAADRLTEYEEIIGYHFEQATHQRLQLGLDDERTRELAGRAAQLLGAAGIRALQRGDALTSKRLLERCRAVYRRPTIGDTQSPRPGPTESW